MPPGAGVAKYAALGIACHQESISFIVRMLVEPRHPMFGSVRLDIKRDVGVDDVVIVNLSDARQIFDGGGTHRHVHL
jgi:hypothetical protein